MASDLYSLTDEELVEKVKEGKSEFFALLVKKYQRSLTRLAWRITKDVDAADDVVQDSMIKAYEKLDHLEGGKKFRSWIFQIVVNTAKNRLRGRENRNVTMEGVDIVVLATDESRLVNSAISEIIQNVVD